MDAFWYRNIYYNSVNVYYIGQNGTLLTWKEGFRYQLQSANYSFSYEPLPGSWSVELDMENLESNRGKVLYEDADGCRIVVSEVNKKAPYQYRVFFRTYGVCDREGGTLVSGRVEARALSTSFIGNDWPTVTAKAGDLERPCPSAGFSGLNWKDGNQFGFHLSISDDRNERAFSTAYLEAQEGPVVVTITNLTRLRTERLWYWSLY